MLPTFFLPSIPYYKNVTFNEFGKLNYHKLDAFLTGMALTNFEKAEKIKKNFLARLKHLSEFQNFTMIVGYDSFMSFSVEWNNPDGSRWMYGGLIYHAASEDYSVHT
jgi:hypothetical protein